MAEIYVDSVFVDNREFRVTVEDGVPMLSIFVCHELQLTTALTVAKADALACALAKLVDLLPGSV